MSNQKWLIRIVTTMDTIWFNVNQRASLNLTSQVSYEVATPPPNTQSVCAVLMCLHRITIVYNQILEAAHISIDDDGYDMMG